MYFNLKMTLRLQHIALNTTYALVLTVSLHENTTRYLTLKKDKVNRKATHPDCVLNTVISILHDKVTFSSYAKQCRSKTHLLWRALQSSYSAVGTVAWFRARQPKNHGSIYFYFFKTSLGLTQTFIR